MSEKTKAYAAKEAGAKFEQFEFEAGELGSEQIEIAVDYCGICHSDLSMLQQRMDDDRISVCRRSRSRRQELRQWAKT